MAENQSPHEIYESLKSSGKFEVFILDNQNGVRISYLIIRNSFPTDVMYFVKINCRAVYNTRNPDKAYEYYNLITGNIIA